MSFGFSIGDFITASTIAHELYQRCKAAVPQYHELSKDLDCIAIVLGAFGRLSDREQKKDLFSPHERANLQQLVTDCNKIFENIKSLLDDHQKLACSNPGFRSRWRWRSDTAENFRNRLHSKMLALAAFSNHLSSAQYTDTESAHHGELLEALHKIHDNIEKGSQTTAALVGKELEEHQIHILKTPLGVESNNAKIFMDIESESVQGRLKDMALIVPKAGQYRGNCQLVGLLLRRASEETSSAEMRTELEEVSRAQTSRQDRSPIPSVNIRLSKPVKQLCPEFCPCSCHPPKEIRSSETLAPIFGRLYLRYCRMPRSSGLCNTPICKARPRIYSRLTYVFPLWLFSYVISATFAPDPLVVVRSLRLVATHADVLRLASINDAGRLQTLFEQRVASPFDASAFDGRTVLHVAVNTISLDSCKFLIEQGAPLDYEDQYGVTPIDVAWTKILGKQGSEDSLRGLESLFPGRDHMERFNFSKSHKAILSMDGMGLEDLRTFDGTEIDTTDSFGITALSWAARRGDDRAVSLLLQCGANANICDIWGLSPLHYGANLSDPNSIQQLISHGAKVGKTDMWSRNPLHYMAIKCSNPIYFQHLVEAEIDINHLEYWKKPPLHVAAVHNNFRAVKFLLDHGAKTTFFDADNDSVLFEAVHHNCHEALEILLSVGTNTSAVNRWGHTILHMAAIYGDQRTMDILSGIKLKKVCLTHLNADGLSPTGAFQKRNLRDGNTISAFQRLVNLQRTASIE